MTCALAASTAVNPARAGMIRSALTTNRRERSKPRASGDDPVGHILVRGVKR